MILGEGIEAPSLGHDDAPTASGASLLGPIPYLKRAPLCFVESRNENQKGGRKVVGKRRVASRRFARDLRTRGESAEVGSIEGDVG